MDGGHKRREQGLLGLSGPNHEAESGSVEGDVGARVCRCFWWPVPDIGHDPHDFASRGGRTPERDRTTPGILARKIPPRRRLIDDHHRPYPRDLFFREVATAHERGLQGAEVTRAHTAHRPILAELRIFGLPDDPESGRGRAPRSQWHEVAVSSALP